MHYSDTIKSAAGLVTTYEETRSGFLKQALEKNRQSTPYVEGAKSLKQEISKASSPRDLIKIKQINLALLFASGVSEKASKYFTPKHQEKAIKKFIEQYLNPAGNEFRDELVFRYLLTKGDSLGGKMRNIGGKIAEYQLIRTMISIFSLQGKEFKWLDKETKKWIKGLADDPNIELKAKGLTWNINGNNRVMIFNLTVPIVKKNVDICLFNASEKEFQVANKNNEIIKSPASYVALGELKGGVDPAGADEHWKTARSALIDRVYKGFKKHNASPKLFFIGAAIEKAMSEEIFNLLKSNHLNFAANLTHEKQMHAICSWLVTI
jgi:type II restriction enzyme